VFEDVKKISCFSKADVMPDNVNIDDESHLVTKNKPSEHDIISSPGLHLLSIHNSRSHFMLLKPETNEVCKVS
jgi:hypothetical protein